MIRGRMGAFLTKMQGYWTEKDVNDYFNCYTYFILPEF